MEMEFYVCNVEDDATFPITAIDPDEVRVHWTATSGGNEPTNVEVTLIKFWNFKATVSEQTID